MALVNSKVDICNLSLGFLKMKDITNIDTPNTQEEKTCSKYYDITRQTILESANWSFAIKRALVAQSVDSPAFGWSNQSAELPEDYLKLISVHDTSGRIIINQNNNCYELEGNRILTELTGPYYIRYIADIDNVSEFDKLFKMNLAYSLSVVMSEAFKVSSTTLRVLLAKWKDIWESSALTVNAQQTNIKRLVRSSSVDARQLPISTGILNYNVEE